MTGPNNVILIDDDRMFNFIHPRIIREANQDYLVRTFDKAENALDEFSKIGGSEINDFRCIIFLDINMPVVDGWGFLERFAEMPQSLIKACKVFMLSSSNDISDIEKSKSYPMVNGFISKPLTVRQFIDISTEEYSPGKFLITGSDTDMDKLR